MRTRATPWRTRVYCDVPCYIYHGNAVASGSRTAIGRDGDGNTSIDVSGSDGEGDCEGGDVDRGDTGDTHLAMIPALIETMQSYEHTDELKRNAIIAIREIVVAGAKGSRGAILEAGVMPALLDVLTNATTQDAAVALLQALVATSNPEEPCKVAFIALQGIDTLVQITADPTARVGVRCSAVACIINLMHSCGAYSTLYIRPPLFQNGAKRLDLRCVLLGAGCNCTRLGSRIRRLTLPPTHTHTRARVIDDCSVR